MPKALEKFIDYFQKENPNKDSLKLQNAVKDLDVMCKTHLIWATINNPVIDQAMNEFSEAVSLDSEQLDERIRMKM